MVVIPKWKLEIMQLKVGSKNEGPQGVLLNHDLVPWQLQDYHDLVPGQFQEHIFLSCIDSYVEICFCYVIQD